MLLPLVALALLLAAAETASAGPASVTAARCLRAPRIDGVIEEGEWAGAARLNNFTQFAPQRGKPATQPTVAHVVYDDTHFYLAVYAYDDRPEQVTARLTQRDAALSQDDSVTIFLDTFHDRRTCYFFSTNPLGTQSDGRVQDNGRISETAWDAAWNVAARRNDDGWVAEFAIPLRIMLFRAGTGRTWGLNIARTRRSNLETSLWAGPAESVHRVSEFGELLGLDLKEGARPYQFIPYALGRVERGRSLRGDLGMDFRYTFRPETTASLTLNPDFATVEADQEFVNLTRFEPQLTEKRPFFLETSNRFRQRIQTFYSRRIADIDLGGNLISRTGPWDFTLLSARSRFPAAAASPDQRRYANYTVARADRKILKSSTLALMTSNRSLNGENRGAVGADTTLFFSRTWCFTGQLARSHGPFKTGRWAYYLRPSYDSATAHWHLRYTHLGDRFADNVNAIGFVRDDDHREFDSDIEKTFWFENGPVQRIVLQAANNIYWSQRGVLRSYHNIETVEVEFRNRWSLEAEHKNDFKLFEKGFHNDTAQVQLGYNTREFQSWAMGYEAGRNFDSDLKALRAQWRRKLTPGLAVEYEVSRVWLEPDPERQATLINAFRVRHNFTRDLFLRAFYQTNSVIDRKNLEAVFVWRYKPPFGSIQFAFQRGRAAFGQRSEQANTYFLKIAHVF